jgi:hypothetical protein
VFTWSLLRIVATLLAYIHYRNELLDRLYRDAGALAGATREKPSGA